MNLKRFENTAHRSFWLVHIEAWHRSGLTRTAYCRQHRVSKHTLDGWLKHLAGEDAARKHAEYQAELRRQQKLEIQEKRRKIRARRRFGVSTEERNHALQAFWAMHVEAMNWSGMGVREYAAGLHLSPTSLRIWRDRLDEGEVEIDWRVHLHPSARPVVGTRAFPFFSESRKCSISLFLRNSGRKTATHFCWNCSSAKKSRPESSLTGQPKDDPEPPRSPVRRFFSDEQKHAIALESDQPGVSVSAVARKHGIVTGMLFRWRVQFGVTQKKRAKLAPVVLPDDTPATLALQKLVQVPDGMMAVDLPDGRRMFVPEGSDPAAVRAQIGDGGTAS